jgi:hypothetical protein
MYVASVLSGCCICYSAHTHMLQTYVVNISFVSNVCCSKYFMFEVFHEQAWQGGAGEGGPFGCSDPRKRAGSEAGRDSRHGAQSSIHGRGSRHEARSCIHWRAAGTKHEAKRSTKLHPWAGSRHRARGEAEHEAAYMDTLRVSLLKTDGQ